MLMVFKQYAQLDNLIDAYLYTSPNNTLNSFESFHDNRCEIDACLSCIYNYNNYSNRGENFYKALMLLLFFFPF